MKFVLSALGSAGDVHPFLAIGARLVERGHEVVLMAAPPFAARVEAAGVRFAPLGAPGDYERMVEQAALWHPRQGARLLIDELLASLPEAYATTAAQVADGPAVLVGSTLSWSMRLLEETHGLPGATVHLAPACLPSAIEPPILPGVPDMRSFPLWARRGLQAAVERLVVDPYIAPRLNAVRRGLGLGLAPVHRVVSRWMHSPRRVLGAWPAWFAPIPADAPPGSEATGFALFHERLPQSHAAIPDDGLEAFLAAGEAPIGITPGSAMAHGRVFFERALAACGAAGGRCVLITPYAPQLPDRRPAFSHHVAYAPFSSLLPRLAGLVHHGGIGTSAQALAAGVPQVVVPFAHDQFDNADRLQRLRVSRTLSLRDSPRVWADAFSALRRRGDAVPEGRAGDAATTGGITAVAVAEAARRFHDPRSDGAALIAERLEAVGRGTR